MFSQVEEKGISAAELQNRYERITDRLATVIGKLEPGLKASEPLHWHIRVEDGIRTLVLYVQLNLREVSRFKEADPENAALYVSGNELMKNYVGIRQVERYKLGGEWGLLIGNEQYPLNFLCPRGQYYGLDNEGKPACMPKYWLEKFPPFPWAEEKVPTPQNRILTRINSLNLLAPEGQITHLLNPVRTSWLFRWASYFCDKEAKECGGRLTFLENNWSNPVLIPFISAEEAQTRLKSSAKPIRLIIRLSSTEVGKGVASYTAAGRRLDKLFSITPKGEILYEGKVYADVGALNLHISSLLGVEGGAADIYGGAGPPPERKEGKGAGSPRRASPKRLSPIFQLPMRLRASPPKDPFLVLRNSYKSGTEVPGTELALKLGMKPGVALYKKLEEAGFRRLKRTPVKFLVE